MMYPPPQLQSISPGNLSEDEAAMPDNNPGCPVGVDEREFAARDC